MNREDIIRLARECDLPDWQPVGKNIERFAALVAAHTLANIDTSSFMSYQEGVDAGRLAEREACAKVCERADLFVIADAIRSRT